MSVRNVGIEGNNDSEYYVYRCKNEKCGYEKSVYYYKNKVVWSNMMDFAEFFLSWLA